MKAGDREAGSVRYVEGKLSGGVECEDGRRAELAGQAAGRQIALTAPEAITASKQRDFEGVLGAFFLAVAVVMLAARLTGVLFQRIGQPRVMGEVTAGILLGPTLFGKLAPDLQSTLFPSDVIPFIGVAANLGLIFYMFLVGLELDFSQLRGRLALAVAISNTGVLIPMVAGLLVALPVYRLVGPDAEFVGFALFMGVSMSITAFPVLARILVERRMLKRPVGALALASAAIDDVTAWFLIALATAVAVAGSAVGALETVGLAVAFTAGMFLVTRRVLARASVAYDEAGRVPGAWIAAIFAGVLFSAFVTETIGIAVIFGAFVMGAVMPRHAGLTEDVTHRVEDFVVTLLLPLFFAYTGLKTNLFLLDRAELVLLTAALLGAGVPRGDVGTILRRAPCDVGVLVAREGERVLPGPDAAVLVPFGGADHDWAALELGAWMASTTEAPLRLLGAAGQTDEGRDATRLLANASLLVQQFAGVHAEPVVAPRGPEIVEAARGAGLLVIGLSERWRQEGLGTTRSEIARAAPAPILFVRRGQRTGALAPRDDVTRFSWSSPAMGLGGGR